MCEPATIAIGAGVLGAVGSISEGQAGAQQAKFQSQVSRNNAILAGMKAKEARQFGTVEQQRNRIAVQQQVGQQRAVAAANGVAVDAGSALDIITDTVGFGTLDELTIQNNAERQALGFEFQAENFTSESQALKSAAAASKTAGFLGAASSILGGAVGAFAVDPKWLSFGQDIDVGAGTGPF